MKKILSVTDFAREIDRSEQYVRALIRTGMVKAQRLNRAYMLQKMELDRIKGNLPRLKRDAYGPSGGKQ